MSRDILTRFLIDHSDVRGEVVQLTQSWQDLLEPTQYPDEVNAVLGEAVAATALLAATIKFEGSLTLQIQGNGGITLLVVQVTSEDTFRAMAKWQDQIDPSNLQTLFGEAQMTVTVEQGHGKQDYQGIVPLLGQKLQDALANYFEQSEQLPTHLWLAANDRVVAGLLLQKLPDNTPSQDKDLWGRVNQFAQTVKDEELLSLDVQALLYRLFHEEEVRLFDGQTFRFACTCSKEKIGSALVSLGKEDAMKLIEERGMVDADCQFCQQHYTLDKVDVEAIFSESYSANQIDLDQQKPH